MITRATLFLLLGCAATGCRSEPEESRSAPDRETSADGQANVDQTSEAPVRSGEPRAPAEALDKEPALVAEAGACDVQDGRKLPRLRLRAIGTEPFWGARIEGRCVTYSHPDDQAGTRVWAKYSGGSAAAGSWTGALGGKPFVLRTRTEAGCSDGMSDRRYPVAVTLLVGGEERRGCAEPL